MATANTGEELKRVIGVPGLALTIMNFTIGAGIFVLPAVVGVQLGAFSVFAYIFCAVMLAAIMLCYTEIGSKITSTGGSYAYVEAAFGKLPGFIINWIFLFGWSLLCDAALMNLIVDSLAVIFPAFATHWIRTVFFFGVITFMVMLNVRGAKQGVAFIKLATVIKILPLLAVIIFGFAFVNPVNLHWENLPPVKTFSNASLLLFFAFPGFESALTVSGEIKNPKRTVPFSILLAGLSILIIYLLLQTVTQGVLGEQIIAVKDAPLAAVANKIIGPVGGTVLLLTAAFSCFTSVSGDVLTTPRLLYAGAKEGMFPKPLAKVHPRFATPYIAIITYGMLILLLSTLGGFKQLAVLASASILLIYLSVILATIKLRYQPQPGTDKTFRMPGGITVPLIGIAAIVWLLTSLSKWELLSTVAFIAIIYLVYLLMKRWQRRVVEPLANTAGNI